MIEQHDNQKAGFIDDSEIQHLLTYLIEGGASMVPGFLLLPARPISYISRSKVSGWIESGLGPRPIEGPPILPPGLSESTMGKDIISTLPKDTDRLLVDTVSAGPGVGAGVSLAERVICVVTTRDSSSRSFFFSGIAAAADDDDDDGEIADLGRVSPPADDRIVESSATVLGTVLTIDARRRSPSSSCFAADVTSVEVL